MAEYTLTFIITDIHSTAGGELSWQVRTASGGGGSLLASGTATSGSPVTTSTVSDPTLEHGSNTRYLRFWDGALNVNEQSFNVEALFAVPAEVEFDASGSSAVVATIVTTPKLPVTSDGTSVLTIGLAAVARVSVDVSGLSGFDVDLTTPKPVTVDASGLSTVGFTLTTGAALTVGSSGAAGADFALTSAGIQFISPNFVGVATLVSGLQAPADVGVVESVGSAILTSGLTAPVMFTSASGGSSVLDLAVTTPARLVAQSTAWATLTTSPVTVPSLAVSSSGSAGADVDMSTAPAIAFTASGSSSLQADPKVVPYFVVSASGSSAVEIQVAQTIYITMQSFGSADARMRFVQTVDVSGFGVYVGLYNQAGEALGSGPVTRVFNVSYGETLDEVGTFQFGMSALDRMAEHVRSGVEARIYVDGEGLVFRGLIDQVRETIDPQGLMAMVVSGDSIGRQLVWANTLLGRTFANVSMGSAVNTLLTGTGWTVNSVQTDARNVTAMFDGASIWQAITHLAETFGWHARERNITRQVDVGAFGADSGLVARNGTSGQGSPAVLPIESLVVSDSQSELWNRVIPVGGGEGINALTLQYATRSSPYVIKSAAGPGGTYWYLENEASVAAFGPRVKVISVDEIVPVSNSAAELQHAANTLYDVAAAWLGWHSTEYEAYEFNPVGLRHVVNGTPTFLVGDRMRLTYRGVAEDPSGGVRVWKNIDTLVWITGYERTFNTDGTWSWSFSVSTDDQKPPDASEAITKAVSDIWAIKTAKRPYTYRETHGPTIESVTSSQTARLLVDFDTDVLYLHRAVLRVRKRRVKSNVTGAAAGGGQTSSSGGGQTTSSGGGQTSSSNGSHSHSVSTATTPSGGGHTSTGGSAHTHTVTGGTAVGSGAHWHQIGGATSTQTYSQKPFEQQLQLYTGPSGSVYGMYVERGGTSSGATTLGTLETTTHTHPITGIANMSESGHQHGILNHTHQVSGQTAAAGGAHTHTVSNHTHTVSNHTHTVSDHTHALVYGVFLGPVATTPQFNVIINGTNRTVALGGPWDNDFLVDITPYLVDGQGHVLRQANNVDVTSSQLCDVELLVKSRVTGTSIVPI